MKRVANRVISKKCTGSYKVTKQKLALENCFVFSVSMFYCYLSLFALFLGLNSQFRGQCCFVFIGKSKL